MVYRGRPEDSPGNSKGQVVVLPGNVHSAEGWEELLLPETERQQKLDKEVVLRADADLLPIHATIRPGTT